MNPPATETASIPPGRAASAPSPPLPGLAPAALAVSVPEPQTPYKNLGLALTVLAAACLAYAGYVRARVLKG